MTHSLTVRVYYEDTDLAGIVYYANYLKYIERARTEWARGMGLDQTRLRDEPGIVLAVRRIVADYLLPARFDDLLEVTTRPIGVSGARLELVQEVRRGAAALFTARVTLAAMTAAGRPARLPVEVRQVLEAG